jgi:hypothetical protein
MDRQALSRLVDAARRLPGERIDVPPPSAPLAGAQRADLPALRGRVAALLRALAERLEPELVSALERAPSAWDQADALVAVDDELAARLANLRRDWEAAGGPEAALALLTLDAAAQLVGLCERRLATLVRLHPGPLLANGRPFLDVPAALGEAARGWS